MRRSLDERIEAYLNGQLSDEETRLFESDLKKEAVAAAFREILMVRTLLSSLPPEEPPPGLAGRIEVSLGLDASQPARGDTAKAPSRLKQAFNGFRWGLRWPSYALAGMTNGPSKMKSSFAGMDTIGYSLGPLINPLRKRVDSIKLPQKPLWKIALSRII